MPKLTLGTKMSSILRKQQNITAKETNANEASCCEAKIYVIICKNLNSLKK